MAENVTIQTGSVGATIAADSVAFPGGSTAFVQYTKLMDGTTGSVVLSSILSTAPTSSTPGLVTRGLLFDSNGGIISSSVVAAHGSYPSQYALNINTNAQQRATYHFAFKPGTQAFTANTTKPWALLCHSGSATKTTKIRRILAFPFSNTIAGQITMELAYITSGSGTPITTIGYPDMADSGSGLPNTLGVNFATTLAITGSATNIVSSNAYFMPILTGSTPPIGPLTIFDWDENGESKPILIRNGIQEGWAIDFTAVAATTLGCNVTVILTEE